MEFLFGSCSAEVRLVFDWCSTILRWRMNWVLGKGNRESDGRRNPNHLLFSITCCSCLAGKTPLCLHLMLPFLNSISVGTLCTW